MKLGSRVARTGSLMRPYKPAVNKRYATRRESARGTDARAGNPRAASRRADNRPMDSTYHEGSRRLQDRFDTRRLADKLDERFVQRRVIEADDRAFIEARDMFFLATADAEGRPQCSYKGGDPGFVKVLDEQTLAFPNYDGNGMYLSMGNVLVNPHVGLLFIDFTGNPPRRLRLNGIASLDEHDALLGEWDDAQFVVRVRATEVFPNCPRYI